MIRLRCIVTALCWAMGFARSGYAQRTVAEQYLFTALNSSRAEAGLPALRWSDRLTAAAAAHADAMHRADMVAHQLDREGDLPERAAASGTRFSAIAENIGVGGSAPELHGMWLQSASHRENMLDPAVDAVGISVLESNGDVWAVEDFARTVDDLSLREQERQVSRLLRSAGLAAAPSDAARTMCEQPTGYVGVRPLFIMRFNATALTTLPPALLDRIGQGRASQATVGACSYPQDGFSSYSIAVALYR